MHKFKYAGPVTRWVRRHGDICLDEYDRSLKDLDSVYQDYLTSCWPGEAYSREIIFANSKKIADILELQKLTEAALLKLSGLDSVPIEFPDEVLDLCSCSKPDRLAVLQLLCDSDPRPFELFGTAMKATARLISQYYCAFNEILESDTRPYHSEDYDYTAFGSQEYAICRSLRDNLKFDVKLWLRFSVPDSGIEFIYTIPEIDDAIRDTYARCPDYVLRLSESYDFSSLEGLTFPDMPDGKPKPARSNPDWNMRYKALKNLNASFRGRFCKIGRYKQLDYLKFKSTAEFDGVGYLWNYARAHRDDICSLAVKISRNREAFHEYVKKFGRVCLDNQVPYASRQEQAWMAMRHQKLFGYFDFDLDFHYIIRWRIGFRQFAQACSLERMCMMAGLDMKLPDIRPSEDINIPGLRLVSGSGRSGSSKLSGLCLNPRFEV